VVLIDNRATSDQTEGVRGVLCRRRDCGCLGSDFSRCGAFNCGQQAGAGRLLSDERELGSAVLVERVERVAKNLQAKLKKLIGIAHQLGEIWIEIGCDFNLQRSPLGLGQLHRGADQGIEIDERLGCRRAPGEC